MKISIRYELGKEIISQLDSYENSPNDYQFLRIRELKYMVEKRKNALRDFNDLFENYDTYKPTQFAKKFEKIFCIELSEKEKNDLFSTFAIKNAQIIKTDIARLESFDDGDSYEPTGYRYLKIYSNEKMNKNKLYSMNEIVKLYHDKKIIIDPYYYDYEKHKRGIIKDYNTFREFAEKLQIEPGMPGVGFTLAIPDITLQPYVIEIIRQDLNFKNEIIKLRDEFKEENKIVSHKMFKLAYEIIERDKKETYKRSDEIREYAKIKYDKEIERADKIEKEFEEDKEKIEDFIKNME